MKKIWHEQYDQGVITDIDLSQFESVVDIFNQSCEKAKDKPAFSNFGTEISYAEFAEKSRQFAGYLKQNLGLQKGDAVAIMMPNLLQYPVALYGILQAGLVVVNVNPLYTPTELAHFLNHSRAKAIVILENFAHTLEEALPHINLQHIITTRIGDFLGGIKGSLVNFIVKYVKRMVPNFHLPESISFTQALEQGKQHHFSSVAMNHEDIAFLQYTGGTTGVSKGAVLTHGNMVANVLQLLAWTKNQVKPGGEIMITALPLYHIFSLMGNLIFMVALQSLSVLITNPRDIPGFVRELKRYRFTGITGVNTLFNALLNNPKISSVDFSKVHLAIAGGMAAQKAVAEKWQQITQSPLIEAYGLTEASPLVTANPVTLKAYNGSIGLPAPSTDVSFRDENGAEVPAGEPGELWVKGPQVMREYWQSPEQTAQAMTEEGWLKTGDIAKMDDKGYIYIVDRKKDTIIVSGFNVFPNEIEGVIAEIEGVLEVAVIGVNHERTGEAVKAFVVKNNPELTEDVIIQHCTEHLTRYKIPKFVEFRESLPKTNVGKILRRALRED